jgi:hypothetical protein
MLHAAGADINVVDMYGYIPIHIAAAFGELEAVETLIQLGADMDAIGGYDDMDTPLIAAVIFGYAHVVEYLVTKVQIQDAHNMTALEHAAEHEYDDLEQIIKSATTGTEQANNTNA